MVLLLFSMILLFKTSKLVSRFSPWAANKMLYKSNHQLPCLAHHGLQRSGTNYLNQYLLRLKVYPLNSFDEKRSSPRHKHCRWYADKRKIPSFLSAQYGNDFIVNNLSELNGICGYPQSASHLVVYKEKRDWLVSILNWGWKCRWFTERGYALDAIRDLSSDYDSYISFWRNFSTNCPRSVHLLALNELLVNPSALPSILDSIGIKVKCDFDGKFSEVPQSPQDRKMLFDSSDIPEEFW